MARKLRHGEIDPWRLHAWAERHYGYAAVSEQWLQCLTNPTSFFNLNGISA
jgi:hypothetical protein